jgi:hypothetical protein
MEKLNRKVILGMVTIVLIAFVVISVSKWKSQEPQGNISSSVATTTSTTTIRVQTTQSPIEGVNVPDGWYTHKTYGIDHEITVLSRTKDAPKTLATEQIGISITTSSLTPEDFIPRQGLVGGLLDSPDAQWSWGIFQGHKTFSMTVTANGIAQWFVYVFGGNTVEEFTLSPNDKTNPNLEKDRIDFWKVITYYAQDSSFEKLSREETRNNCKTVTLPSDQEPTIQAEPDTGYVVTSFVKDGKKTYSFFNFNDDLSSCTPSVKTLLKNTKAQMSSKAQ